MKALSLKQPWAELVVSKKKTIELRKWNTKFRGNFLIHASKIPDKNAMQLFGYQNLPTGCVVGKATIINVKKYTVEKDFKKDKNKHLAAHTKDWGSYGFILTDIKRVKLIMCNGKLGFWNYKN